MTNLAAYRPFYHPIARTEEITEKPRTFTLLGERLVAFRTDTGICAFKDVCVHRGAALSLGRVVNGNIECPYHGWQYNTEGKCVRIPSLKPNEPIPSRAKAITYPICEMADLVWVALEQPIAPFPSYPEEWAYGRPDMRSTLAGMYDWPVDAGRAVENFLDVGHFPFVHEGTLGTRDNTYVTPHDLQVDEWSMRYSYDQVEPADVATGEEEAITLMYYYRAPFTVHLKRATPHPEWSVASLFVCPVTEKRSRLFVTVVRNFDMDPEYDHIHNGFMNTVMTEDKAVISSVRPEEIPVSLREELHIKVPDASGIHLRRILGKIENHAIAAEV